MTLQLELSAAPRVLTGPGAAVALSSRDAALLAWLALEGPTPRGRLALLMWPGSEAGVARNALRQRLFQLRRSVGVDVVVGKDTLTLADGVEHDLADADTVLADLPDEIGGEFSQWLAQQRARRQGRKRHALVELADRAAASGDYSDALTHAEELLAIEPLSEDAHRRLMQLHYLAGNRAAALLAFDRCEQMLKDEVGTTPSADTLTLLQTIEAAAAPPKLAARTALPASILRPPRLVGRDREYAALQVAWDTGQVACVIGEAGMGKSRLLQTFIDARPGVVMAAGRPGDAGVPYATLVRLLHAAAQSPGVPAPGVVRTDLADVLPELRAGLHAAGSRDMQHLALERAVRHWLDARAGLQGFVVDDLHFADEASLDMLAALIAPGPRVGGADASSGAAPTWRWFLACRPAEVGTAAHRLQDQLTEAANLLPVSLRALDIAALAALVDSLALPGLAGAAVAPGLLQCTGGNPLFVLETLKRAWSDGALATLGESGAWPRPTSVSLLIQRRLALLSPEALSLARVAAVAGCDFSLALAEQVLRAPAIQFADALVELESAHVLRDQAFAHDLVFEAVHAGVPPALARHVHGQVAQWLEGHECEPARVARHWVDAGQAVQALPWLERAAAAAKRALRVKEYIAFMEEKSRVEEASGRRQAAFASMRLAAEEGVQSDEDSEANVARCHELARLATTAEESVRVDLHWAFVHQCRFELDESVNRARAALERSRSIGHEELVARSQRRLGANLALLDRPDEAVALFEDCGPWFERHANDLDRAEYYNDLSILYGNLGRINDALPAHRRAVAGARCAGDHGACATSVANLACNRMDAGALEEADEALVESLQMCGRDHGLAPAAAVSQFLRAQCLCHLGRYRQALDQAQLAVAMMQAHQPGGVEFARLRLAACWWHLGQGARLAHELAATAVDARTMLAARALHARLSWHYANDQQLPAKRVEAQASLAGLLDDIGPTARPDLAFAVRIDLAWAEPGERGLAVLQAAAVQAERMGHLGIALAANVRCAAMAIDIDPLRAAVCARRALELHDRGRWSTTTLPAELWLHAARALSAAGDAAEARRVLNQGVTWLRTTAREHVPEAFRDGFLHRNPVNRELLALDARLPAGA